jgi:hypothetical protein
VRAIVHLEYGSADDLELREVPRPAPRQDEVLVRVHAASMHADIWHVVTGRPYFLRLMGAGLGTSRSSRSSADPYSRWTMARTVVSFAWVSIHSGSQRGLGGLRSRSAALVWNAKAFRKTPSTSRNWA